MKRVAVAFVAMTFAALTVMATISLAHAQQSLNLQQENSASARTSSVGAQAAVTQDDGPVVQASERISIPYGITDTLPLRDNGQGVVVIGHGGCTAGQTVTVLISVTQATAGAEANGQTEQDCTGARQVWSLLATTASTPLQAGAAEACGLATTYDGEEVTDTYEWCRQVTLAWPLYLPLFAHHPEPVPFAPAAVAIAE